MAAFDAIVGKREFLAWTGEDPRLDSFIDRCERDGMHLRYTRGERHSYIDVVADNGSPITCAGTEHTLDFDCDDDMVIVLGCADVEEGLGRLRGYLGYREDARLTSEIASLRKI